MLLPYDLPILNDPAPAISMGTTLARAVTVCHERGAKHIYAAASHGVFVGDANDVLSHPALDKVVVTNSIPPFRLTLEVVQDKLVVLEAAALFAKAITCIHSYDSSSTGT